MKHQLILILALTLTQATYSQKITTFTDPTTGKPASFAGAGVNSMVPPIQ